MQLDNEKLALIAAAGLAGIALERFWLGRRRQTKARRSQAKAQLEALQALTERLDDDFEETLTATGVHLQQQLVKVHSSVDSLIAWVEMSSAAEFPTLADEWRALQHKVHRLSLEISRFENKPNRPPTHAAPPKRRWMLEDSDTVERPEATPAAAAEPPTAVEAAQPVADRGNRPRVLSSGGGKAANGKTQRT